MGSPPNARLLVVCSSLFVPSVVVGAQRGGGGTNPIASLEGVAILQRPDLARHVADPQTRVVLGKAPF